MSLIGEDEQRRRQRASDSGERQGVSRSEALKLATYALHTIGGILLTVISVLTWKAYDKLEAHDRAIVEIQANARANKESGDDFKMEVRRGSEEVRGEIRRMSEKIDRISEAVGAKKP